MANHSKKTRTLMNPTMKVTALLWHPQYEGCDIALLQNEDRTSEWLGFSLGGNRYLLVRTTDEMVYRFMDGDISRGDIITQGAPWILARKSDDATFSDLVMTESLPKEWITELRMEVAC